MNFSYEQISQLEMIKNVCLAKVVAIRIVITYLGIQCLKPKQTSSNQNTYEMQGLISFLHCTYMYKNDFIEISGWNVFHYAITHWSITAKLIGLEKYKYLVIKTKM